MKTKTAIQDTISFVMWLSANYPEALYKYAEDDDGGRLAFEQLYEEFKEEN